MLHTLSKFLTILCMAMLSHPAMASWTLNMPQGVSSISHKIYDLHMIILWIVIAIGVVVFAVMFYAIIFHRKSRGHQAAEFHEHTMVEVLWAIIPAIILVVMAIPATKVLYEMNDTRESEINIKIIGHQWKWQYEYLDEGIKFFSNMATPMEQIHNDSDKGAHYLLEVDHPLVVPVGAKIRFLITSNDVIHSWWVPELGIKKDAIPGYIRESWVIIDKPGTYRGQCAELCGVNHAFMPIVVIAKTRDDYRKWLDTQRAEQKTAHATEPSKPMGKEELMHNGEKIYKTVCMVCHQANGAGVPGVFKPIKNSPVAKGPAAKHIRTVLHGVKNTAMQSFAEQLSDEEIAEVVTYERNAFGNNVGDLVQPADVKKIRESEGK